jgi:hypothetical protein
MAGQMLATFVQPAAATPHAQRAVAVSGAANLNRSVGQAAGRATIEARQSVSRGIGAFLYPFRRVGGILWLEVTGVLFLLPALLFAPALWRAAIAYPHTADHKTLWVTAGVVAVFLYLGVSSFWRAHRRSQRS